MNAYTGPTFRIRYAWLARLLCLARLATPRYRGKGIPVQDFRDSLLDKDIRDARPVLIVNKHVDPYGPGFPKGNV